jgi:hypothetical protein
MSLRLAEIVSFDTISWNRLPLTNVDFVDFEKAQPLCPTCLKTP